MSSYSAQHTTGEARKEHGQLTPEPSVEPEQLKSVQPTAQSNDESKPIATAAGPSTQPSADVDTSADSAGQSNPAEVEPKENEPESSASGDVGQTAPSTSDSTNSGHPTVKLEPTEGATTGNGQPSPGVSELQSREVDRIMAADPKLAFQVLGLAGLQSKDEAEERYQKLVELLGPGNCGHPQASDAIKRLDDAIRPYRSADPVTTGAEFVDANGDPMDTDSSDSQSNESTTSAENVAPDTGNNSSSLIVPEESEPMQTSESTDGAASDANQAWPYNTGLTCDGKRIMAYRTHGRGYRAIVEPENGSEVFDIRSGMECGGAKMQRYLAQEKILQLKPPAQRKAWSYKHRGDFVQLWYLATSDYKTHNTHSKSGGCRKDPEAWAFVEWKWGPEEITVSDLRKVTGRESADAAIRTICERNKRTTPMEQRPQQVVVKTTPEMFVGNSFKETQLDTSLGGSLPHVSGSSKPAVFDAVPSEQAPKAKIEQVAPAADLSSILGELNKKLDRLEKRVEPVDELLKSTTLLTQIVAKLADKVGLKMDG